MSPFVIFEPHMFGAGQLSLWIGILVVVDGGHARFFNMTIQRCCGDALFSSSADSSIHGDAIQPRIERSILTECAKFLPGRNERLLRGVQSVFSRIQSMLKTVHEPILIAAPGEPLIEMIRKWC